MSEENKVKDAKFCIIKDVDIKSGKPAYVIKERRRFLGVIPYWGTVYMYKDSQDFRADIKECYWESLDEAKHFLKLYRQSKSEMVYYEF